MQGLYHHNSQGGVNPNMYNENIMHRPQQLSKNKSDVPNNHFGNMMVNNSQGSSSNYQTAKTYSSEESGA